MYQSLYHGLMEDVLPTLNVKADLIMTSPPYADKRKSVYGGVPSSDYAEWLFQRSILMMDVLSDTGSLVVNIKEGAFQGVRQRHVLEYLTMMSKQYRWVETFIWVKTNPYPTGNTRRLKDAFEYCYQFTRTKDYKFYPGNNMVPASEKYSAQNKNRKNKGSYSPSNGSGLKMSKRVYSAEARPSNVINIPCHTQNTQHCAAYPIGLPEFFVTLMTDIGDVVIDPFAGSGTTLEASAIHGRGWVGVEKELRYYDMCCERMRRYSLEEADL